MHPSSTHLHQSVRVIAMSGFSYASSSAVRMHCWPDSCSRFRQHFYTLHWCFVSLRSQEIMGKRYRHVVATEVRFLVSKALCDYRPVRSYIVCHFYTLCHCHSAGPVHLPALRACWCLDQRNQWFGDRGCSLPKDFTVPLQCPYSALTVPLQCPIGKTTVPLHSCL